MAFDLGTIFVRIKTKTDELDRNFKEAQSKFGGFANKVKTSMGSLEKAGKVAFGAIAGYAVAAGLMITRNIGRAIDRIDTLVAFPRMLQALGATSEEAQAATKKLKKSLEGLPTPLQDGASSVQQLVAAGLGVGEATDAYLAFNNAMLAAGVTTGASQATFTQLTQAISRGKIEGQEWNSISANMPSAMKALQEQSGLTKVGLQELYRENPHKLLDDLIKLNEEGGGGLASLDEQARTATGGIKTSFDNLDNAITRGIESIVMAVGGGDLEAGQEKIASAISRVGESFESALGKAGDFVGFMVRNQNVFAPLIIFVSTIIGLLATWFAVSKLVAAGQAVLNAVMSANPIGLVIIGIIALIAAFMYLWNNVEGFRNFWIKVWSVISDTAAGVFNWLKKNWPLLLAILTGPIGLAVLAVVKNFDKIKAAVSRVWNWIKGAFSNIGEIGAGIVKSAVNTVLSFAQKTINGFIRTINGAIGIINKIPKVNIPNVSEISLPKLATGTTGWRGGAAIMNEFGPETAVLPRGTKVLTADETRRNESSGNTYNIHIKGALARSESEMADIIIAGVKAADRRLRAAGKPQIMGGTA